LVTWRIREERKQRVRDHNTIWGPFGRNLHEDLLGITGQGVAMQPGQERRWVLHGRHENDTIHDDVGMRHYYAEWQRRMGIDPAAPYAGNERIGGMVAAAE
jgi:methanesulfonate monooxygenase large subunit